MSKVGESELIRIFSDLGRKGISDNMMVTLIQSLWRDYLGLYIEKFLRRPIDPEDPKQIWLRNRIAEEVIFGQAIGQDHLIGSNRSNAIGQGGHTTSFMELLLGAYPTLAIDQDPENWIPTDRLMALGNGLSDEERSLVFEILKNGFFKIFNGIKIGKWEPGVENVIPENGTLQWTPENGLEEWKTDKWISIFHPPATIAEDSKYKAKIGADQVLHLFGSDITDTTSRREYGTVTWLHDLVFQVSECGVFILGNYYVSAPKIITLEPADADYDRIDSIYVDITPEAGAITGEASEFPIPTDLNPLTQLLLRNVTVSANVTAPVDITEEVIYNENIEWESFVDHQESTAEIDFEDTNTPFSGGVQTRVTFDPMTFGRILFSFIRDTEVDITNSNLVLSVRTSRAFAESESIYIKLLVGLRTVSDLVIINDGKYGFNSSLTGYQTLTIPMSDFKSTTNQINAIRFAFMGGGSTYPEITTIDFDLIKLQTGAAIDNSNCISKATPPEVISGAEVNHYLNPKHLELLEAYCVGGDADASVHAPILLSSNPAIAGVTVYADQEIDWNN